MQFQFQHLVKSNGVKFFAQKNLWEAFPNDWKKGDKMWNFYVVDIFLHSQRKRAKGWIYHCLSVSLGSKVFTGTTANSV